VSPLSLRHRLLIVVWALAASGCVYTPPAPEPGQDPRETVMIVNGLPITRLQLEEEIDAVLAEAPPGIEERELREKAPLIRDEALRRLIFDRIIEAAVAEHGIEVSEAEVDDEIRTIAEYLTAHGRTLPDAMREMGDTTHTLRMAIRRQLTEIKLWDKLLNLQPPTEEELRAYYQAHREWYVEPDAVLIYQIVKFRPEGDDSADADERLRSEMALLRNRWLAGEDFTELARRYSDGAHAAQGGKIGWITADVNLPAEVVEAAFTQQVNQVGEVVQSPMGYHLVWVAARRPRKQLSFEEARPVVEDHFSHERRREPVIQLYEKMRQEATIIEP